MIFFLNISITEQVQTVHKLQFSTFFLHIYIYMLLAGARSLEGSYTYGLRLREWFLVLHFAAKN